jgi:hypothetical protein
MAIDWRLVISVWWKVGARDFRGFLLILGVTVWHSVYVFGLGEVLGSVGRLVWRTAASNPRGATHTPGYVVELYPVWFGGILKFCLGFVLRYTGRLAGRYFFDTSFLSMLGSDGWGQRLFPSVFRFVKFVWSQVVCFGL